MNELINAKSNALIVTHRIRLNVAVKFRVVVTSAKGKSDQESEIWLTGDPI